MGGNGIKTVSKLTNGYSLIYVEIEMTKEINNKGVSLTVLLFSFYG